VNYCDQKLIAALLDAMLSTNARLAGPAAQLTDYFSSQAAYRQWIIGYYLSGKWEEWQKELLKKQLSFLP
jgi:hypothetical protein